MVHPVGAHVEDNGTLFCVWAPLRKQVAVHIVHPFDRIIPMTHNERGYWTARVEDVGHSARYMYRLDNSLERPDPASCCQPGGVHESSMVVDHSRFQWRFSSGGGVHLRDYIMYELHVGTFTPEGTFDAAREILPQLAELGVTAVEIMPVAQFPGKRNWGYDGVYPFSAQYSYGGYDGFKAFVDECHRLTMAVILDVVYNHLGPEGNYLRDFAPYFTNRYTTPWGEALNFDGPYSDGVCDFFIANALYWFHEFQLDALRLDAVHAIADMGARPFLLRLADTVSRDFSAARPPKYLIAESDLNDSRIIRDRSHGGYGIHAQWSDDFHHAVHCLLANESSGYYADFGSIGHLEKACKETFVYNGIYSEVRKRSHGNDVSGFHSGRFVVCSQNHDQVGNRMLGERLFVLAGEKKARLAAAWVVLSPYIPLLFMGEEYGEDNPFLYFVDHTDPQLNEAVREGRKQEFAEFHNGEEPPDPCRFETFERSCLDRGKQEDGVYARIRAYYGELIRLRCTHPALGPCPRERITVVRPEETSVISIHRYHEVEPILYCGNFGNTIQRIPWNMPGVWHKRFDSRDSAWSDESILCPDTLADSAALLPIGPYDCVVYSRT